MSLDRAPRVVLKQRERMNGLQKELVDLHEPAEHIGSGVFDESGAVDAWVTKSTGVEIVISILEY